MSNKIMQRRLIALLFAIFVAAAIRGAVADHRRFDRVPGGHAQLQRPQRLQNLFERLLLATEVGLGERLLEISELAGDAARISRLVLRFARLSLGAAAEDDDRRNQPTGYRRPNPRSGRWA